MIGGLWIAPALVGLSSLLALTAWRRRADARLIRAQTVCGSRGVGPSERASLAVTLGAAPRDLLRGRSERRLRAVIDRQALDFIEVLLAAIEAGLPPATAVERAAGMTSGVLGRELDAAAREIELGIGWRAALEQLVRRTHSTAFRRLTVLLSRAHRLGISPRQSLRSVADELRLERRSRAEEIARRAPVKMLFPLVLLILPAFLLLTVGPVLLATVRSLR